MKITFSKEAKKALLLIQKTRKNVFITGKAGTGKSTLLQYLRDTASKKTVVIAPTGVAAINVRGDTIHSFFKLKPGFEKEEAAKMRIDPKKQQKYKSLETILIDEISMVRADLLDAIDIFLRRARNSSQAFGGVQMVFFGDLYQLPPVITPNDREKFYASYTSPYFFNAEVFQQKLELFGEKFEMEFVELKKMYRQTDPTFIDILNAVRDNSITEDQLDMLNSRYDASFEPPDEEKYIHLMTTNSDALAINTRKLSELPTKTTSFTAKVSGNIAPHLHPNDETVTVKVGAQVMFIHNDSERKWVNGTLGKIIDIKQRYDEEEERTQTILVVEKTDGTLVEATYFKWEISRYVYQNGIFEREIMGSFEQVPLKLAWAITIHKSQGKTFEKVVIDLGRGSFAHGQTYVALSRCTSLNGIVLKKRLDRTSIIMDSRVQEFRG